MHIVPTPETTPLMISVTYTMEEIQALTSLLDMATKAGGLSVVGSVAMLHQKHLIAAKVATDAANTPQES